MAELLWQDPPPRRSGSGGDYAQTIEALKANPGKWALVIKDWKTSAAPAAFRQAGCEATTRRKGDKKSWDIYARYPAGEQKRRADAGFTAARNPAASPVQKAVSTGTALRPPAAVSASRPALPEPEASGGYTKFLRSQRAGAAAQ